MRRRLPLLLGIVLLAGCAPERGAAPEGVPVRRGDLRRTVPFQGELSTRRMELVGVGVHGSAVLVELAAEGSRVEKGDVVARFDAAQLEQDLARQEYEVIRATQELASLEKAELPLELLDLQSAYNDAAGQLEEEKNFLESIRGLTTRGLMSDHEVQQQEEKIKALGERLAQMASRIALTKEHMHGARLSKARATLAAAERQRDFTAGQIALCEVRAPADGAVALLPLPVNGEYRTAHVGDTLFRNQVFLCIPDPQEYVLRGYIGEGELSDVRVGARVTAAAAAFPEIPLQGVVESVGSVAQTRPGDPAWKKSFPVVIALAPLAEELPVGLTTRAEITAGEAKDVLLVPRAAVSWEGSAARVRKRLPDGIAAWVDIETGLLGALECEIRRGLTEGDTVLLP